MDFSKSVMTCTAFFRCMEFVTKAEVNTNNIGTLQKTNIQSLLLTAIRNDKYVMKTWDKISSKLSAELGNLLLTEVMTCYVKMRLNAFLRVYIMILKERNQKVSKKGEKSLRRDLEKESKA